jgi:metal-sulfur cluster biosynthetic enzyme
MSERTAVADQTTDPQIRRIATTLHRVPEPCGILMREPIDIVDMGLVDVIEHHEGHVRIVLVLTDASCVHFTGLQRYIADVVGEIPGIDSVTVEASTTEMWTPDRRRAPRGVAP